MSSVNQLSPENAVKTIKQNVDIYPDIGLKYNFQELYDNVNTCKYEMELIIKNIAKTPNEKKVCEQISKVVESKLIQNTQKFKTDRHQNWFIPNYIFKQLEEELIKKNIFICNAGLNEMRRYLDPSDNERIQRSNLKLLW